MKKNLKIAVLHPVLEKRGGAENILVWLVKELCGRQNLLTIFTCSYDDRVFGERRQQPFEVKLVKGKAYQGRLFEWIRIGWKLKAELRRFDLVIAFNFPTHIWLFFAKLFSVGRPFPATMWYCNEPLRSLYPEVCFAHSSHFNVGILKKKLADKKRNLFLFTGYKLALALLKQLDKIAANSIDQVVAISDFIAGQLVRLFSIKKIKTCYPGIQVEEFFLRNKSEETNGSPYLMTVSRLEVFKNIQVIIEAVKLLKDRNSFFFSKYIIVGSGPFREDLEQLCRRSGLEKTIEFKGHVSEEELVELYANSAAIILMSLDETFGLTFLEAAVFKKPFIGPDQGGPKEIIDDGVSGFLVDPSDPVKIAQKLSEVGSDLKSAQTKGEEGYRRLMESFTIKNYADRLERIIAGMFN